MDIVMSAFGEKLVNNAALSRALLKAIHDNIDEISKGGVLEYPAEFIEKRQLTIDDIKEIKLKPLNSPKH